MGYSDDSGATSCVFVSRRYWYSPFMLYKIMCCCASLLEALSIILLRIIAHPIDECCKTYYARKLCIRILISAVSSHFYWVLNILLMTSNNRSIFERVESRLINCSSRSTYRAVTVSMQFLSYTAQDLLCECIIDPWGLVLKEVSGR